MQSLSATIATTTTTLSTHRRHTDAPGYSRNRSRGHGPAPTRPNVIKPISKPVQPASSQDFHLDVFFNPLWMSGPHVFSFAKDGTVVRPDTYHTEPYPGYRASAPSSSGRNVVSGASSSASSSSSSTPSPSFPSPPICKASGIVNKDWKNVAISEQDDAEFAAIEAEAQMRAQAEAKRKLVGLVYTWPPKPLPGACTACEVLAVPPRRARLRVGTDTGTDMGTQERAVPALSYGSSGESESESEVFCMVPGRRAAARRKDVPLEGSVGIGSLPRLGKAPAPGMEEGEGESARTLSGAPRGVGEDGNDGCLSPLTAISSWAEDQLTVSLKAMLRMHEVQKGDGDVYGLN